MSLTTTFLDELRARTTLSTLIGRTVKVTKAGREFKACCPFHNEKSPSFTINDEKGFYHCLAGETKVITSEWVTQKIDEVFATLTRYDGDYLDQAKQLFAESALSEDFEDFLTLPAYDRYLSVNAKVGV